MNKSGIKPVGYYLLVEPRRVAEKTGGGLYLPEQAREKEQFAQKEGVVLEVGCMAFGYDDWPDDQPKPQPGDTVLFSRYQADEVRGKDGEAYWLLQDKAVVAVMEAVT